MDPNEVKACMIFGEMIGISTENVPHTKMSKTQFSKCFQVPIVVIVVSSN